MMRSWNVKKACVILVPLMLISYFGLINYTSTTNISSGMRRPIFEGPCEISTSGAFNPLSHLQRQSTDNMESLMQGLFPPVKNTSMTSQPYFVTGLNSRYFLKGKCLAHNIIKLREKYTGIKLIVFDLGMSKQERVELLEMCACEIRDFPFHEFPPHVQVLKGYSFKPLAIQLVAREHPFVIWADTSVRILTIDMDSLFQKAQEHGILATEGYGPIATKTTLQTFVHLGIEPCVYRDKHEIEATLVVLYTNQFIVENIVRPWVRCALTFGCMMPVEGPTQYLKCPSQGPVYYHMCHRFDQSVLGILLHGVFGNKVAQHLLIANTFFKFCRSSNEVWWLPRAYNKWRMITKECNRTLQCLDL